MSNLKRLLRYLLPYWPLVLVVFVAMLANSMLELSPSVISREILDKGLANKDLALIIKLSLGFILVAAVRFITNYVQWYVSELLGQKVIYNVRQTIHDHLQSLPPSYFSGMGTGQVMSRLTSDIDAIQQFVGWGALLLVQMIVQLTVISSYLAYLNLELMLVSCFLFPLLFRNVMVYDKTVRPAWKRVREKMGKLTEVLQENISGVRVVKAFAREPYEIDKFAKKNQEHYDANMERAEVEAKAQPVLDFLSSLSVVILVGYGGYMVQADRLTVGTLFAFYISVWSLIWPIRMLGWIVNHAEQALAAAPRLFELLDTEPAIKNPPEPIVLDKVTGRIAFENVSFSFPGDSREALKNVNLEIAPGERVAVVGSTGSGKSTLVNLLPRFLDPVEGRVTLDGYDLRDLDLTSLRRQMGIVLQDNFLFSATVRENIALGKPDATLEEIQEAARLAQADGFIQELPRGYDTPVGERGIGLSGGQRQRIALARALLVNPRVLVLDEATSSVDTETEYLIQEGLEEAMKGRTCIIIAKRLSTIRGADRIVIMDQGRVVEIGTHEELLSKPGFYRNLFESQFAEEDVPKALAMELAAFGTGDSGNDMGLLNGGGDADV
ncbi:MAG TPA: ABC transporter ATP-binding protein [Firmicutes bacterium]|nr:ABC transporter ATP-binding protein [Candidatus Fermentithermobacillaceae bacterium]